MDGNGNVTGNVNFEPANGTEDGPYGEIVDIKQGPDGALYYVDIGISWQRPVNPGTIRRIRYTAANQPPNVVANATPRTARHRSASRSSTGSSDPEAGRSYSWTFGDGQTSALPNPTHVYSSVGNYTARLTVSDLSNQTISAPIAIAAGNGPQATITTPTAGSTFGRATPSRSAAVPPTSKTARSRRVPGPCCSCTSPTPPGFPAVSGVTSGSFLHPHLGHDFSGNTTYQVVLTVTDSDGLQNSRAGHHRPRGESDLHLVTIGPHRDHRRDPARRPMSMTRSSTSLIRSPLPTRALGAPPTPSPAGPMAARRATPTVPATSRTYAATFNASAPAQLLAAFGLNEGTGDLSGHFGQRQQPHFDQHHVDDEWPVVEWPVVQRHEPRAAPPAPWIWVPSSRSRGGS